MSAMQAEKGPDPKDRIQLFQKLSTGLNEGELQTLCMALGIDYENLPAQGKENKIRELIRALERRGRLSELVELYEKLYPSGDKPEGCFKTVLLWFLALPRLVRRVAVPAFGVVVLSLILVGVWAVDRLSFVQPRSTPTGVLTLVPTLMPTATLTPAPRPTLSASPASASPTPQEPIQIGVATFKGCSQMSDALEKALDQETDDFSITPVGAISDGVAARAQEALDLVLWGQCDPDDGLTMHLELLAVHPPDGVIELERVTALHVLGNLDYAQRMVRAVVSYVGRQYEDAAIGLSALLAFDLTPYEKAELSVLWGNSLLYVLRYEEAMDAYTGAVEFVELRDQAHNNRGVAATNQALQLRQSRAAYREMLQEAINDLEITINSNKIEYAFFGYINLASARYIVDSDYDQAQQDCQAALDLSSGAYPLGYVCRAAARFAPLLEGSKCDVPALESARQDLYLAEEKDDQLPYVFYWRGHIAHLEGTRCPVSDADRQAYAKEVVVSLGRYKTLLSGQAAELATDRYLKGLMPRVQENK